MKKQSTGSTHDSLKTSNVNVKGQITYNPRNKVSSLLQQAPMKTPPVFLSIGSQTFDCIRIIWRVDTQIAKIHPQSSDLELVKVKTVIAQFLRCCWSRTTLGKSCSILLFQFITSELQLSEVLVESFAQIQTQQLKPEIDKIA